MFFFSSILLYTMKIELFEKVNNIFTTPGGYSVCQFTVSTGFEIKQTVHHIKSSMYVSDSEWNEVILIISYSVQVCVYLLLLFFLCVFFEFLNNFVY